MKKIFLFTILFIFSLLIWSPKISLASLWPEPEEVFNGSGTENNPFEITTCEQLQNVGHYSSENYYFILNNNIDCSDTINWNDGAGFMPIGYTHDTDGEGTAYGDIFVGNFDGNNKTISDLYINRPTYYFVGLFGQVEQFEIKNLGLTSVNITGKYHVGGLVGANSQSHIENTYTTGNVSGEDTVGGLVGYNYSSSILNSYATGNVIATVIDIYDINGAGGLVGINYGNIENTFTESNVTGNLVGGLVGSAISGMITNSYATRDVSSEFIAGGLIGSQYGTRVVNSYAIGDVSGSIAGGLVGNIMNSYIYNSYSTGNVTGIYNEIVKEIIGEGRIIGGLVGVLQHIKGQSVDDYIFNSGWYQSRENSDLSGIGLSGYYEEINIFEGPAEVTYTETNNRAFYDKDHGVYDQTGKYAWGFNGNPWYEYSDNYPKFTEPQGRSTPGRSQAHSSGSGSSPAIMASFQAEQLARALATGADITPYLNPSNSSGQVPNPQPSVSDGQSPTFGRTLKQGMTGDDVKALQTYLNTHGYDCGIADGVFGLKTKQAVIKFQIANGLIPDGVVGPLTQSKMN